MKYPLSSLLSKLSTKLPLEGEHQFSSPTFPTVLTFGPIPLLMCTDLSERVVKVWSWIVLWVFSIGLKYSWLAFPKWIKRLDLIGVICYLLVVLSELRCSLLWFLKVSIIMWIVSIIMWIVFGNYLGGVAYMLYTSSQLSLWDPSSACSSLSK